MAGSLVWILACDRWRRQPDHMQPRQTALPDELPYLVAVPLLLGELPFKLLDHVPELVDLLLPRDLRRRAARVLQILLAAQHPCHVGGLGAARVPDVDRS